MAWKDLSISQRSYWMNQFRRMGVPSLSEMSRLYDTFAGARQAEDPYLERASAPTYAGGGRILGPGGEKETREEYIAGRVKETIKNALHKSRTRTASRRPQGMQEDQEAAARKALQNAEGLRFSAKQIAGMRMPTDVDQHKRLMYLRMAQQQEQDARDYAANKKLVEAESDCIYTATDSYGEQYLVPGNKTFLANPQKYGFTRIKTNEVQPGDIVQMTNVHGDPSHAMIFDGYDENGTMRYNYSPGIGGRPYVHHGKNPFAPTYAYRFVGTSADSARWTAEYNALYKDQPVERALGGNKFEDGSVKEKRVYNGRPIALEEYQQLQAQAIRETAVKKALTRTEGVAPVVDGKPASSCIYTFTDNYGRKYQVAGTQAFAANPEKYGFEVAGPVARGMEGNMYLMLDENGKPYHANMITGYDAAGNPLVTYSQGHAGVNPPEKDYHKNKPLYYHPGYETYKFVGTPEDKARWKEEWSNLEEYPNIDNTSLAHLDTPLVTVPEAAPSFAQGGRLLEDGGDEGEPKKQNWFVKATLGAMMADSPAVATASGWTYDNNGNIVQTEQDSEGARKLRESLTQVALMPLTDVAFGTVGTTLTETKPLWAPYASKGVERLLDYGERVFPRLKPYLGKSTKDVAKALSEIDVEGIKKSVRDYQMFRDLETAPLVTGIEHELPQYRSVLNIRVRPATIRETLVNGLGLTETNAGYGSWGALNKGDEIVVLSKNINPGMIGHELRHSIQKDFTGGLAINPANGEKVPISRMPLSEHTAEADLQDLSSMLKRYNPNSSWHQRLTELDAEIENVRQSFHPNTSWKELMNAQDERLDKSLNYIRNQFHLSNNDEANYLMEVMYKHGYTNGGSKIHIKKKNRGKFTRLLNRTGHSASWFKAHGTPAQKKMAVFALNAKKWKHEHGGIKF